MKDVTLPKVILAFVLLMFACGLLLKGAALRSPVPIRVPTLEATEPPSTEISVVTETPVVTATAGIPITGAATVQVSNLGDFGLILVDGEGFSLYVFTSGAEYHSSGPCSGEECLEEWTPVLTGGGPLAGQGVDPNLLGTITRADGTIQVTYNGWPLYRLFPTDKTPGDVTGQADDNEWYLISPSGDPIQSPGHE